MRILPMAMLILGATLMGQTTFGATQEIVISTAAGDQQVPAVFGALVVWEDKQSGTWNIAHRDISLSSPVTRTLTASGENRNPSIWGKKIVWQVKQPEFQDWDICGADVTEPESPVFQWIDDASMDQMSPRVWANDIVYQDNFELKDYGWDVILVDISDFSDPQYAGTFGGEGNEQYPAIGDKLFLYQSDQPGDWDIAAWDVRDTSLGDNITPFENDQQRPATYGDWVMYQSDPAGVGDWDIIGQFTADLFLDLTPVCTREDSNAQYPALWNSVVVWQDDRNGNWDIYGYNLATTTEFRVTDNSSDQIAPAIGFSEELSKYVVVWQDKRNGNWDIYGALIDGADVAGCASPLKWDINADSVVDDKDIAEVQQNLNKRNGITP